MSMSHVVDTLEHYEEVISWVNDALTPNYVEESTPDQGVPDLTELDQLITQLLTTLDIGAEDTSSQLERIIDDVSRGIPRVAYDLHFMKDGASTLQNVLLSVLEKSRDTAPEDTSTALDTLHHLDTIKIHMEAAREVLREAENWSTLEQEVTSLIAEKSYTKAAERLSEANRSMVVFQNTAEYDPRRTLLVNLQNQLEAALSTALLSAINTQDLVACKDYFSIFSIIQRESEFRNYYYASRRSSVVSFWQKAVLSDCGPKSKDDDSLSFTDFLPKFFSTFLSLLNHERGSIVAIFPDPAVTMSQFISSTMSSLQPTMSQRLALFAAHHGDSILPNLISAIRVTEEFANGVHKMIEKMTLTASPLLLPGQPGFSSEKSQSHRRRSSRMSISMRSGQQRTLTSPAGFLTAAADIVNSMEWDRELFQPFLDHQVDYGSLERRHLEKSLYEIIASDTRGKVQVTDRPRLFRERAIDIFGVAEGSTNRCKSFTHGYGAVGLLQALDGFFQSFIDMWTADLRSEAHAFSPLLNSATEIELADLDYSTQDWSDIQLSLHLLASARSVHERITAFETRLRTYLAQVASHFRLASSDPSNFLVAATKGESQLLEQSLLNSAELHSLLSSIENELTMRDPPFSASLRQQPPSTAPAGPLLANARKSLSTFAHTCQSTMIKTILSPLRKHLTGYAALSSWRSTADPNVAISSNDLQVPTFSLSPTDTVQRVAEVLLNLPRLFEVYAEDDALAFSLETLPYVESPMLKSLTEHPQDVGTQASHRRRPSNILKPATIDAEAVSSTWLISIGQTFLEYLTTDILPSISTLSTAGAAQLLSDLEYLSNIVRAINVEHVVLEKWKTYVGMSQDDGVRLVSEVNLGSLDPVLDIVSKLRGWR